MAKKHRKQIKHTLKMKIDQVDKFIELAHLGETLNTPRDPNTEATRKAIVSELNRGKKEIADITAAFIAEIEKAIQKMS